MIDQDSIMGQRIAPRHPIRWVDAAPPKATKKAALGALHHCIPENEWSQHRVIKRGTRWVVQWSPDIKAQITLASGDTIKIGDRIKFKSPTLSGPTGAVWRKVNGFSNGKPTVAFNTWPDFVVRESEIIGIDPLY